MPEQVKAPDITITHVEWRLIRRALRAFRSIHPREDRQAAELATRVARLNADQGATVQIAASTLTSTRQEPAQ